MQRGSVKFPACSELQVFVGSLEKSASDLCKEIEPTRK